MATKKIGKENIESQKTEEKSEAVIDEKKSEKVAIEPKVEATEAVKIEKAEEKPVVKKKKKIRRQVLRGQAHIQCTYNNTIVTFSDLGRQSFVVVKRGAFGIQRRKKGDTVRCDANCEFSD